MGLFDFFKKKKNETIEQSQNNFSPENNNPAEKKQPEIPIEKTQEIDEQPILNTSERKIIMADFQDFKKYSEYVISAIMLQHQDSFAPISAYEELDGTIKGFVFMLSSKTGRYAFSPEEAISGMKEKFEKLLPENKIRSFIIGYHSQFNNDENYEPSTEQENFRAITFYCNFGKGSITMINLPYKYGEEGIGYAPIAELTEEENNIVFNTQLDEGKQYYTERDEIKPPSIINEYGIEIESANEGRLGDLWAGTLGFERVSQANGSFISHLVAAVFVSGEEKVSSEIEVKDIESDFLLLRSVEDKKNDMRTAFPVIKTDKSINVTMKTVSEWNHMENMEGVIYGSGKDTFGLTFFATDYSYNKEKYKTSKNLDIQLSGIILHAQKHEDDPDQEFRTSENFTMYMPNQEVNYIGGFDFIGIVKNIRPVSTNNPVLIEGYMLDVQLITYEEEEDFFTIEMFLNKENSELIIEKGMKITGLFLLQGKID
ncbi:hypothetical protein GCM10023210_06970 [Chryseobacterium ginsengisoli]|uniref:Uncharacterized protein n=1 Tax=Chryseobacterium ginsengisoli TaxID=363853 RepID=A0ABP9LVX3_9FLAO